MDRKTCTSDPETAATDAAIAANCNFSLTPLKQMIYNPDMKTSLCDWTISASRKHARS
ncbi:hypothetical protein ANFP_26020 [Acidithiobacillus ferrooxidans]|jgi:hypothetical protein|nr:hypothetical protein ANFP_26020 [Acidithiobacillus ferrooxidans]